MEGIEINLHQAIEFVNNHKLHHNDRSIRDKTCNTLTNDLIKLDSMQHPRRKITIVTIQNILGQLDSLYEVWKPFILISSEITVRTDYLPDGEVSLYALGTAFNSSQ